MKILLRFPNWLGDAIMATPTLELLKKEFLNASFTLVGPSFLQDLFKKDSRITKFYIDSTKENGNRIINTYKLAKKISKHDISIAFNNNIFSALMLYWTKSSVRIGYAKNLRSFLLTDPIKVNSCPHQVISYARLAEPVLKNYSEDNIPPLSLKIAQTFKITDFNKRIGISPGAAYGISKMWLSEYFIEVILYLLNQNYHVYLYGSKNEKELNEKIYSSVKKLLFNQKLINNLINLTGQTSISQLIESISELDLFLCNDSGPMHIASALKIPLIAIFGPMDVKWTLPWKYNKAIILDKHLSCAPCKKRICPLKHHNCMKLITPDEVIYEIQSILR